MIQLFVIVKFTYDFIFQYFNDYPISRIVETLGGAEKYRYRSLPVRGNRTFFLLAFGWVQVEKFYMSN